MKPRETSFARLISEVESGSQEASWELIATYSPFVFRVVRKLLPRQMRKAFDSADFVQVAWGTMFRHRSRLCRFETPAEFTAFLAAVTANKVRMEIRRRLYQQKHNITRDVSIGQAEEDGLSDEPSPSQVAIARERWFQLLEHQPPHYQEIIKLRYLGHKSSEIARRLGLDEGTVRRVLRKIFGDLKHECRIGP